MSKSPDAFRTISEVAEWLDVPTHVLRFWESRFTQIKPVKRAGGRRYYRPADMALLGGIKRLLHDDGLTIRGVQKLLREQGVRHVSEMSPPLDPGLAAEVRTVPARDNVVAIERNRKGGAPDPEAAVEQLAADLENAERTGNGAPTARGGEDMRQPGLDFGRDERPAPKPDDAAVAGERGEGHGALDTAFPGAVATGGEETPPPEAPRDGAGDAPPEAPSAEAAPAPPALPELADMDSGPLVLARLSAMGARGRAARAEVLAPLADRARGVLRAMDRAGT